jgi:hypothetical protein
MFISNWLSSMSEHSAATWSTTPKANTCKTEQRYAYKYYSYHQHSHIWTMKSFNNKQITLIYIKFRSHKQTRAEYAYYFEFKTHPVFESGF